MNPSGHSDRPRRRKDDPAEASPEPHAAEAPQAPPDRAPSPDREPSSGGLHWLRHAGVGPRRQPEKRISGADVTSLGSLEAEIMGLLWEIGRPANGMEVAEAALYKRRAAGEEPIAFSTVNTTLRRLADKGVLVSQKGETRTPYYTPTVGREEMAARILNNVSEALLGKSLHGLLPKLVGGLKRGKPSSDPDAEDIRRLMRALEEVAAASPADPSASQEGVAPS